MNLLEPITEANIHELKPGEWIWDTHEIHRRGHTYPELGTTVLEPIGFRQITLLHLNNFGVFNNQPFMLSTIDRYRTNREWIYFSENRFYRFKRENSDVQVSN